MQRVPHDKVIADQADVAAVAEVVRSGHWAMGPATLRLEEQLARVCKRRHAIAVASGLSALRLSLVALGVKPGDHVGVPAYSCVALANAVVSLGASAVPVDCDPDRLVVARSAVRKDLRPQLRCLVVINTFGIPADFPALMELGIPLVEDCTQGFGHGPLGSQGAVTVISFSARKFLDAGRGGAILTDDDAIATMVRDLRKYADKPSSALRLNDQPDDLNAALALNRLSRLYETIGRCQFLANRYQHAFKKVAKRGHLALPIDVPDRVWYRYTIRISDATLWIRRLSTEGIECAEPVSNWLDERQLASCPNTAGAYRSIVALPFFPALTIEDQDRVIRAVTEIAWG